MNFTNRHAQDKAGHQAAPGGAQSPSFVGPPHPYLLHAALLPTPKEYNLPEMLEP